MRLIGTKTIETERLILRKISEEDFEPLYNILSIPEVNKYYLTSKLGKTFEEEKRWLEKKLLRSNDNDYFTWSIIKKWIINLLAKSMFFLKKVFQVA